MSAEGGQEPTPLERRVAVVEEKLALPIPITADDVQAFRKVADVLAVLVQRLAEEEEDERIIRPSP